MKFLRDANIPANDVQWRAKRLKTMSVESKRNGKRRNRNTWNSESSEMKGRHTQPETIARIHFPLKTLSENRHTEEAVSQAHLLLSYLPFAIYRQFGWLGRICSSVIAGMHGSIWGKWVGFTKNCIDNRASMSAIFMSLRLFYILRNTKYALSRNTNYVL